MTATVRYVAPLLWQGTPPQINVRQANPVVWSMNYPQLNVRQAVPVVWSQQNVTAYIRGLTATQWIITPIPLQLREVTALQWSQDLTTMTARKVTALQWTQDALSMSMRSLKAITWAQLPTQGSLRQASAYTLQISSSNGQLRQAGAYTLQLNRKPATTGGLTGLWPLIQADAKITVNSSNLSVSAPVVDTSQQNCNTYVTVAPIGSLLSSYSGSYKLYYHRQDMSYGLLSTFSTWKLGTIASNTTILALLSQINSAYGVSLDPTDVVDGPVLAGATQILLTAASTSWVYKPGTTVYVMNQPLLSTAVAITNLPGFNSAGGAGPLNNTLLLMHFDGTNGSTSVPVSGMLSLVVSATASGTAALTTAQSKFGGVSLALGATTSSAVTIPDNPSLRFSSDCTIECWAYTTNVSTTQVLFGKAANGSSPYAHLTLASGTFNFYTDSGTSQINATSGMVANTWYHIAVVRRSGVWTIYVNGTSVGSINNSGTFGNNAGSFYIGNWGGLGSQWLGEIDEFRISNIARYNGNFTPPSAAFTAD